MTPTVSISHEQQATRARVLEALRMKMLEDRTISGATIRFADGEWRYVHRADLLRRPERADA
ncbi:MAG TPA: hypothetical protein VIJ55_03750 [Acetobacteraceae bacterium]